MASRIALGITIAVILATCYLGFTTKTKIEALNADLAQTKATLKSTQATLASTQAKLKSTEDELAKTQDDLKSTQAQLTTTQSNLDAANAKVTDLTNQIADLNKKLQDALAAAGKTLNGGPTPEMQAMVQKLSDQLKDAQAQVAELNQVKDTLTNKLKDSETHADDLQKVVDHYKNNILKNGLEGEVLAVNPGWNFVVLSIGDRQGAVVNGELILKRNGSQIGKVKITSVDPSTSVADIVPGSLARGVRVQPGDRVIYQSNEQ